MQNEDQRPEPEPEPVEMTGLFILNTGNPEKKSVAVEGPILYDAVRGTITVLPGCKIYERD